MFVATDANSNVNMKIRYTYAKGVIKMEMKSR